MTQECGTVSVTDLHKGFGLSTQEAWIQQATLKDNVLFGDEFDADKYEQVIDACALKDDIKVSNFSSCHYIYIQTQTVFTAQGFD